MIILDCHPRRDDRPLLRGLMVVALRGNGSPQSFVIRRVRNRTMLTGATISMQANVRSPVPGASVVSLLPSKISIQ